MSVVEVSNITGNSDADITSVTAGTAATGGGASGAITIGVDVGTSANQVVRLDSSAKLPAVDGSALTNIVASTYSGIVPLNKGGTGNAAASANAAFNVLSPMTTGGDIIYGGASGAGTRLANGSAGQVLTSAGTTLAPTWTTVSSTGTANTFALFSSGGALTSSADVGMALATFSMKFGLRTGTGNLASSGNGSLAYGSVDNGSTLNAGQQGATATGVATATAVLNATGSGAFSSGYSTGVGATVTASGVGAHAFGYADVGATVLASGNGAMAFGHADTGTVGIRATVDGALAGGYAFNGGSNNAEIRASNSGSMAHGYAEDGANIIASGIGARAFGYVGSSAVITASGQGAFATGRGNITSSASGSFAGGWNASAIITSSGNGAFSYGDDIVTSSQLAQSMGLGHVNSSYICHVVGRYSTATGTTGSWVDSEPLFIVGNGASTSARNNAFAVRKAGNIDLPTTITTPGTTGNQTINKLTGAVNIAAAGTTVTVTNSLVTANSIVIAVIQTADATATLKNVVPGSGSFVINIVAATAETRVGFMVIN